MTGAYSRYMVPSAGAANDDVLVVCAAAVAVRDAVYLSAANLYGRANGSAEATMPCAGIVVSKPTATSALIRRQGELDGFVGLTPDVQYFVGLAAGAISTVPPAVAGQVVQSVGRALNVTTLTIAVQDDDYTVL
jgi:hypothetical protein